MTTEFKKYDSIKELIDDLTEEEKALLKYIPTDDSIADLDLEQFQKVVEEGKKKFYIQIVQATGNGPGEELSKKIEWVCQQIVRLQHLKYIAYYGELGQCKYFQVASRYGSTVQQELKKHIGEVISDAPLFVIAHEPDKQIKEAHIVQKSREDPQSGETFSWYEVQCTSIILDGILKKRKIQEIEDALTGELRYSIEIETNKGATYSFTALTLPKLTKELSKTTLVYKPRVLQERLAAVINAYRTFGSVERSKAILDRTGFFWVDDKLVCVGIPYQPITKQEAQDAVLFIQDLKKCFYQTELDAKRLAHLIKIGIAAPYDFARRQNGAVSKYGFIPRVDLYGEPDVGKTDGTFKIVLGMYELSIDDHIIGYGSVETNPRFMNKTGRTTMTIIIDEADELTDWSGNSRLEGLIALMKNTVSKTDPRDKLNKESEEVKGFSCAHFILTHNSDKIDEDGFLKRFTSIGYTKTDRKSVQQIKEYESFWEEQGTKYRALGNFAIDYVMNNQKILFDRWDAIAIRILQELYKLAETPYPEWLNQIIENTAREDSSEEKRTRIQAMIIELINDTWYKHRHEAEVKISKMGGSLDDLDLVSKFRALVEMQALSQFAFKTNGDVCILSSIKEKLKKYDLERVSLKQLAELCGFRYDKVKMKGQTPRAAMVDFTKFAEFLSLATNEEDGNAGDKKGSDDGGNGKGQTKFMTCNHCGFECITENQMSEHTVNGHGRPLYEEMIELSVPVNQIEAKLQETFGPNITQAVLKEAAG